MSEPRTEVYHVTAGALVRRQVRRQLMIFAAENPGFSWREERGWLDSLFECAGTPGQIAAIERWANQRRRP